MRRRGPAGVGIAAIAVFVCGSRAAIGQASGPSDLQLSTRGEFSTYADSNDVFVYTPAVVATLSERLGGWSAGATYLADIVSAASVDIVSTATPAWREVRHAGRLSATYKPDVFGGTVSGSVSNEPDYLSLAGGGSISLDLAEKTVTLVLGYTYAHDTAGRVGTPFSVYSLVLNRHAANAAVSLILDPESALTFGVDVVLESGRQEKPYRYVPLFDANVASGVSRGDPVDIVNSLRLPGRTAEALPGTRQRLALAARFAQRIPSSTFVVWQRGYADDWGVLASTTDLRLVFDVSRRVSVWPHLRGHIQSGASFWQLAYVASATDGGLVDVPRYRTGDRELSPFQTGLAGAGARVDVGPEARPSSHSLVVLADGSFTSYDEALFIKERAAFFGSLQFEAEF